MYLEEPVQTSWGEAVQMRVVDSGQHSVQTLPSVDRNSPHIAMCENQNPGSVGRRFAQIRIQGGKLGLRPGQFRMNAWWVKLTCFGFVILKILYLKSFLSVQFVASFLTVHFSMRFFLKMAKK